MAQVDLSSGVLAGTEVSGSLSWDLSGLLAGMGDTSGSIRFQGMLSGAFGGLGDVSPVAAVRTLLVGGSTAGVGEVYLDTESLLMGLLAGQGGLSGDPSQVLGLSGWFSGVGDVVESAPLPLYGFGEITAYVEFRTFMPPICPLPEVPSFRWQSDFGRCSLVFKLCDARGLPYSPVTVLYELYQVMPGGYRLLRGPPNRQPIMEDVGSYYATGTAGECGQPGDWVIVWRWQRDPWSPVQTREMPFRVVDWANCDCDTTPRVRKYGWDS